MKPPVLLMYNLTGNRGGKVNYAAIHCGIRMRTVETAEYAQPIGALCGLTDATDATYTGEGFKEEMLVMAFFSPEMVNRFLDTMRQTRIAPVRLKAVLTATNCDWDSVALHDELTQESIAMEKHQAPAHQPEA